MEILFIYLLKSSGLITLFFLAYYFLLQKETFFTSNRWFLIAGLITSALLPLLVFTKTIWVEASATAIDWSHIPAVIPIKKSTYEIDWFLTIGMIYTLGIMGFLIRFGLDYYSLTKVFKGKTIQQQADFKFIDVNEKLAPFSFFNTIVYNSALYSRMELENIIEHEKVHSEQKHTVDVLVTRLFSIMFWFNPIIWLYQKAILQNLEFIADSEALLKISDKKAYQITLLKITTHENCVALSNHFYQSLIKKRIVMLNKNQSKKSNSWKYLSILPALIAFVFLFQINVVAQEKVKETKSVTVIKNSADIANGKESSNTHNDTVKKTVTVKVIKNGDTDEDTTIYIDGKEASQAELDALDANAVKTMDVNKNGQSSTIKIITKNSDHIPDETEIYIDGKKTSKKELDELDPNMIAQVDVQKSDANNTKRNTIRVVTKTRTQTENNGDKPNPPTPPQFPKGPLLAAPQMSNLPAAPSPPKNIKDRKSMAEFEEKMKEFEKKMESFEPDMTAYEKKIEEIMAKREAIFEKEMKKYEKAMEKYREAIEKNN
ncbi:M56 family metallopeptidase [Flavobacterium frigoris]|uniref:Regulatory sensor-transducer, BlaR1/MecR1 family / TonB-dependent receptor n=1 Tax=Flavobacterium frigoris (strain PS1) TaxID=1086011 RepID=H7FVS6_FLAFP|nr:M56 family metallopeptidase [Flavobacterium frigoris]EIA07407.1 regulatory sensor-transducer, BlaR1/MecR1 family / TonB-dependent receptor [Flavobacterium frigoris PS1]